MYSAIVLASNKASWGLLGGGLICKYDFLAGGLFKYLQRVHEVVNLRGEWYINCRVRNTSAVSPTLFNRLHVEHTLNTP